jgi:predicted XRE-type DNA-binding protein
MSSTRSKRKPTAGSRRREKSSRSSKSVSRTRTKKRDNLEGTLTIGSGNVFYDIGFPRPEADILLVKADLTSAIWRVIEQRGLSQKRAAAIVGLDQPKISLLKSGDTRGFSVDRLLKILSRLGYLVNISIEKTREMSGPIRFGSAEAKASLRQTSPKRRAA